jgi:hypothetical protein
MKKRPKPTAPGGLKSIPSVVQLPGGIQLQGLPFKIVEYNPDGTPKLFELLPSGEKGPCVLFAQEAWIRSPIKISKPQDTEENT